MLARSLLVIFYIVVASATLQPALSQQARKYVVIRLDDADQDQYVNAIPVLKRLGLTATFCIPTGSMFVGNGSQFMTWSEVTALYAGGFEVASHSATHPNNMNKLSSTQLTYEAQQSAQSIQAHSIPKPTSFCYPNSQGYNNSTVTTVLSSSGYRRAASGQTKPYTIGANPYAIYAYPIDIWDGTASDSYFRSVVSKASSTTVVVLMFHHVTDTHPKNEFANSYYVRLTGANSFTSMMTWLRSNGYTVIQLDQIPGT